MYDNSGNLAVGGQLYTYAAGTSTPLASYTDSTGSTPNANPVIMNSRGEASVWLTPNTAYKLVAYDSLGNLLWTQDQVTSAPSLSGSTGSASVGFIQAGTGAVAYTAQAKMRQIVSVMDFGAKGDGVTDDTTAFQNCINSLQTNSDFRGGEIYIPSGHYILKATLTFTAYVAGAVHNIYVRGNGSSNTYLDFSGTSASTDGISFNTGSHFGISDLTISGAGRNGIALNTAAFGTSNYCQQWYIRNVRTQAHGGDGLVSNNCFMGEISNVWSRNNLGNGISLGGYHTSLDVRRSYASGNGLDGWDINGIAYSNFTSCGSDTNTRWGWTLQNAAGVNFVGCGAESNQRDPFYFLTQTVTNPSIPSTVYGLKGVSLINCTTVTNSLAGAGLYSSFLAVSTANGINATVGIYGGYGIPNTASDVALVLNGTSGNLSVTSNLFDQTLFTPNNVVTGSTVLSDFTRIGRFASVLLNAAQSISSGVLTLLTPAAAFTTNTLNCTISGNTIVIPKRINNVRVSCSVDFAANATGVRQVYILHNGVQGVGLPSMTVNAASAGDTVITVTSSIIPVAAGDTFSFQVYQNSGGALNVSLTNMTWFSVEGVS
jgi:hypothetical protein